MTQVITVQSTVSFGMKCGEAFLELYSILPGETAVEAAIRVAGIIATKEEMADPVFELCPCWDAGGGLKENGANHDDYLICVTEVDFHLNCDPAFGRYEPAEQVEITVVGENEGRHVMSTEDLQALRDHNAKFSKVV